MTTEHGDHVENHSDKFNDPRVRITRTGILMALAVVVLGVAGAALSIWARKTRLEHSTEFWGPEVVRALQLAQEVELIPEANSESSASTVRLTGMPGLGHLRHVLLDDRSYDWSSAKDRVADGPLSQAGVMVLRFTDAGANRFPDADAIIDLEQGWVGLRHGKRQVQLNERFRTAVPTFLKRVANYEQLRSDLREDSHEGGD